MSIISMFNKGVGANLPHHYETFGGKRHREPGKRPAPARAAHHHSEHLHSPEGHQVAQPSGATAGVVEDFAIPTTDVPFMLYAFGATQRALGYLAGNDEVDPDVLKKRIASIGEAMDKTPRPFYVGERSHDIWEKLKEAPLSDVDAIEAAIHELAQAIWGSANYLFDGSHVHVVLRESANP